MRTLLGLSYEDTGGILRREFREYDRQLTTERLNAPVQPALFSPLQMTQDSLDLSGCHLRR
jgi:hypothetical protein